MNHRYSPRFNITLPQPLVDELSKYQKQYGLNRSELIRAAIHDWLSKQPKISETGTSAGSGAQPERPKVDHYHAFNEYLKPGMSSEEMIQLLKDWDASSPYAI